MKPSRRQMLRSAVALAAGAVGIGAAATRGGSSSSTTATPRAAGAAERHARLLLHGTDWHALTVGRRAGIGPEPGDRVTVSGELADESGTRLGSFSGSCFCVSDAGDGVGGVELHTLNLGDGTVHGMGTTTPGLDEAATFAVVGGTGRFEGASGSYVIRQRAVEFGGDGSADVELTLRGIRWP